MAMILRGLPNTCCLRNWGSCFGWKSPPLFFSRNQRWTTRGGPAMFQCLTFKEVQVYLRLLFKANGGPFHSHRSVTRCCYTLGATFCI